jgi:hypothetical protein
MSRFSSTAYSIGSSFATGSFFSGEVPGFAEPAAGMDHSPGPGSQVRMSP